MSKLLDLKKQVPLTQAAKYLARVLEEEVTESDILSFGLSGKLQISVFFVNGVNAHPCKLVPKTAPLLTNGESLVLRRVPFGEEALDVYFYDESLRGLFDLPMVGGTYDFVLNNYQKLVGGPERKIFSSKTMYVTQGTKYYELCEWPTVEECDPVSCGIDLIPEDCQTVEYDPSSCSIAPFPEDCQIVVRTSSLRDFEESILIDKKPKEPPEQIIERERKSGKNDYEIAATIDAEWTGRDRLSNREIGQLLPANPGTNIEPTSQEKRGKRLRKKLPN